MEPSVDSETNLASTADETETTDTATADSPPHCMQPQELQYMELHSSEEDSSSLEAVTPPLENSGNGAAAAVPDESPQELQMPASVDSQTVRVLDGPSGVRVWLIGTAHFSRKSQDDVAALVHHVKPHVLMLELCASRAGLLQLDEDSVRQQLAEMSTSQMVQLLRRQGAVAGCLHLLLLHVSAKLTQQLGMAPGGELRRAYNESLTLAPHRCLLHLGDRPIQVTMKRALSGLGLWQRMRLAYALLTSKTDITREEVERCKERDVLENMMAELAGDFPSLGRVFVEERDRYLSGSLWRCCLHRDDNIARYYDQQSPRSVLAVVGMGHLEGILQHWGKVTDAEMRQLLYVAPPSMMSRVVAMSLRLAFWSVLFYAGYKMCPVRVRHTAALAWLAEWVHCGAAASRHLVSTTFRRISQR